MLVNLVQIKFPLDYPNGIFILQLFTSSYFLSGRLRVQSRLPDRVQSRPPDRVQCRPRGRVHAIDIRQSLDGGIVVDVR
jgi:hypothetical protein